MRLEIDLGEIMRRKGKMTAAVDLVCEFCSDIERMALRLGILAVFGYGLYEMLRRVL